MTAIDDARTAWHDAEQNIVIAMSRLAEIESELARLQRQELPDAARIAELLQERGSATRLLLQRRAEERVVRERLRGAVAATIPARAADFPLLQAEVPIVFLPVRLETRFERRPPNAASNWRPSLMVRIYPDEIQVSTHESPLTAAEAEAGIDYWKATIASLPVSEAEAWRKLLVKYPSPRAAWIVLQTRSAVVGNFGSFPLLRPSTWSRPAVSYVMPDCFVVRAYIAGNLIHEVVGKAIPDPLPVSLDPFADPADANEVSDLSGNGLELDRDIAWMLDFTAAEQVGMAVRIPPQPPTATGYDELFAVGLKGSLRVGEAQERLTALFDAHHYSRGFAFPRLGTPTKNTSEARSGHPMPDPRGAHSFPIERGAPLNVADGNGMVLTHALGLAPGVTEHVENAQLREQANARAFNAALWPATVGYFLRQMLHPLFSDAEVDEIRNHFVDYVFGRGPLPPIRIGNVPYGVLPATSVRRWSVPDTAPLDLRLGNELQKMLALWSASTAAAPRLYRSADVDADLLSVLSMDGRSRYVNVRPALGPVAQWNLLTFLGVPPQAWQNARTAAAQAAFAAIGRPQWDALIGWMSFDLQADRFGRELVTEHPSESDPLPFNYIRWLRSASVADLRAETFPAGVKRPTALLYHVLRHAILHEYLRLADVLSGTPRRPEEELIGFGTGGRRSGDLQDAPFQRLARKLPITGSQTIAEYLLTSFLDGGPMAPGAYRGSLAQIEDLPTEELERLFTETLDTCSHRLDAWITSLATRRLELLRRKTPSGVWLAAYGWLEKIVPPPGTLPTQTLPDGRVAIVQTSGGGHIHAPGMAHASAAAVLRNAALTRGGSLDLSSDRVRRAMQVLEAVRTGEMAGSILGAQFERGLRARGMHADLQKAIDGLRNLFPLVANKRVDSHDQPDAVAARGVVDGLHLYEAFRDGQLVPATLPFAPAMNTAVDAELRVLGDTIDAITELLTAESTFQSLRGNHEAGTAAVESMSRGVRPPELEVVRQPRGGTTMTHRFAVILGSNPPAPPGWTAPASRRSAAAPHLDAWIGRLIGDPNTIGWRVTYPAPTTANPNAVALRNVGLIQLQLRPIDFLAITRPNSDGSTTELELRIAAAAQAPLGVDVKIDPAPLPSRNLRNLVDMLETTGAIRDVIQSARPLRPDDLLGPEMAGAERPVASQDAGRATAAHSALVAVESALQTEIASVRAGGTSANLAPLRAECVAASKFGVDGAYAASRAVTRDELLERAELVHEELQRRAVEAGKKTKPHEIAQAVFGRDFVFLYEFLPWQPAELGQALANAPALTGNDPLAVRRWLQSATPVRPALQRWRNMTLRTTPFVASPSYDVVQLPFVAGAPWVALPFAGEAQRPPSGRTSIVLHRAAAPAPTAAWCGLLLDEWTEVIPAAAEQSAVALGYESPRPEAPRAVLIGVPPPGAEIKGPLGPISAWNYDLAFDVVRETLQLARLRALDLQALGSLGQLVPSVVLGSNPDGETISTDLASMLVKGP